jgi:hypothetical protein
MQSEVLPSELHLVAPPVIPQARSYIFKQKSDLLEYPVSRGTNIKINIPRLQRSYLTKDSYLRFRLNIDYTVPANNQNLDVPLTLDRCGAYGLIDRIEVYDYLGGTLLESTQNIPALMTLWGDLHYGLASFTGQPQVTEGYDGSRVVISNSGATPVFDQSELRTSSVGQVLAVPVTQAAAFSQFSTTEFAIPLPSFLGLFSDKYAPLHNGFTLNIILNDSRFAFISRLNETAAVPSLQLDAVSLSQVELCCQVMELGEQAEQMVMAGSEPAIVPCIQHRYFTDLILGAGSQSSFRLDMNLNVVSLRKLWWMMRPTDYQGYQFPTYGHRIRNFLDHWNFQYGSSYLPEIAGIQTRALYVPTSSVGNGYYPLAGADFYKANSFTQAYRELVKTADDWRNVSINLNEFRIDTAAYSKGTQADRDYAFAPITQAVPCYQNQQTDRDATICGKFAAGLNMRLSHKAAVSGIDTNGLQVSINGYFDKDKIDKMIQATLDVWAQYDAFVQVLPGVATTVSF